MLASTMSICGRASGIERAHVGVVEHAGRLQIVEHSTGICALPRRLTASYCLLSAILRDIPSLARSAGTRVFR
jgi:hypothetical protein